MISGILVIEQVSLRYNWYTHDSKGELGVLSGTLMIAVVSKRYLLVS